MSLVSSPPPVKRSRHSNENSVTNGIQNSFNGANGDVSINLMNNVNNGQIIKIEQEAHFPESTSESADETSMNESSSDSSDEIRELINEEEDDFFSTLNDQDDENLEGEDPGPKYPVKDDSLILYLPEPEQEFSFYLNPDGYVPVVLDPLLALNLKEDQKIGLKFMFSNIIEGNGCILAHEMGVGKTFTTISLIHLLLEQSVQSRRLSTPTIKNVVIVAPKSVVGNWKREFKYWTEDKSYCKFRPSYDVVEYKKNDEEIVSKFLAGDSEAHVLILSTQKFFKYFKSFRHFKSGQKMDLIVFDEAHNLKNSHTHISKAAYESNFKAKILLTGTPVQNNFQQLFNLIDIAQPDALLKGTNCTEEEFDAEYRRPFSTYYLNKSSYRLDESQKEKLTILKGIISKIIDVKQNKVDVPKHEIIICLHLSFVQKDLYREVIKSAINNMSSPLLSSAAAASTAKKRDKNLWYCYLTLLKAVSNHPMIAYDQIRRSKSGPIKALQSTIDAKGFLRKAIAEDKTVLQGNHSQKLRFILFLVHELDRKYKAERSANREQKLCEKERVVVVSSSTAMLDRVENFLKYLLKYKLKINCLKLYGSTAYQKRQTNIDDFNNMEKDNTVFLLSLKAGGFGTNLTGGNHIVLLDPDWNPANDEQAMARIWREGQKRPCYIYRLFCTGTVEEVIYKRQETKKEIKRYVTDDSFTSFNTLPEKTRELFTYNEDTLSSIHDAVRCTKSECISGPNSVPVGPFIKSSPNHEASFADYALGEPYEFKHQISPPPMIEDEYEEENNISTLANWEHFKQANQLPRGEEELPVLKIIWERSEAHKFKSTGEPKDALHPSFMFYRKVMPETITKNCLLAQVVDVPDAVEGPLDEEFETEKTDRVV